MTDGVPGLTVIQDHRSGPDLVGATVTSGRCHGTDRTGPDRTGPDRSGAGLTRRGRGYDVAMSEPTSESPGPDSSAGESDDDRLVPDEKLPDDLNPEKNPLAAEPDDDTETGFSPTGPDAAAGAPGG